MSDVSKINIEGLTLNIKDTVARNDINHLTNEVNSRSFILIGDSFSSGIIDANNTGIGWLGHFKEYTKGKYRVYNNQVPLGGAYGFASSRPFIDVIKDCETQVEDKTTITDIVVLGGTNDLGVDSALIEPAIKEFAEYCHTNFPKALVKIGLVGTAISSLYGLLPYYRSCNKYGCVFIQDTLCLMNDPSLISDGIHLTQAGYNLYDPYICDAILSGRCYYKFTYDLPIKSNMMTTGKIYIDITEKGYSIQMNSGVGGDYLQAFIFEVTTPNNGKFTQIIGTVDLPSLFMYYIRLQNGKTSHVVRIGEQYVVSSCRQFSIWLSPSGELYCEIGAPAYPDAGTVQSVIIGNEPYTYLV